MRYNPRPPHGAFVVFLSLAVFVFKTAEQHDAQTPPSVGAACPLANPCLRS